MCSISVQAGSSYGVVSLNLKKHTLLNQGNLESQVLIKLLLAVVYICSLAVYTETHSNSQKYADLLKRDFSKMLTVSL